MKLTARLVSLLLLGALVLLTIDTFVSIRREVATLEGDMRLNAGLLGRAMRGMLADVWSTQGEWHALDLVRDANEAEKLAFVRFVWLDAPPGDPACPRAPMEQLAPVRRGEEVSVRDRTDTGEGFLRTYVPFPAVGPRQGALEISQSLVVMDKRARAIAVRGIVLALAMALVGGLLAIGLGVGLVGHRLRRLGEKIHRVGEGDLSQPLMLGGNDELSQVATGLNRMCEHLAESQARVNRETERRMAALDALRHADRLRTVGQLASGLAHELGTPLNVVSGRAELIASGKMSPAETVESASIIRSQSDRMASIVRQLLGFARRQSPKRESADLLEIAHECQQLVAALARKHDVDVSVVGDAVRVSVDRGQLQQVFMNLLMNALQASPQHGRVEVSVTRREAAPPGERWPARPCACVCIQDNGEGIPKENVERIFEPFFTTKRVGEGTGLGLSTAQSIVEDHDGWIDVKSELGVGSRFTVYLPEEAPECREGS
jgi:two-component system NtrC family sensor kinase